MKPTPWIASALLIALATPTPGQACCGHRARCGGHHHRAVAVACVPTTAMPAPTSYATPQAMTGMPAAPVPVAAVQPAVVADPAAVQPSYEYAASPTGQPAYYYTYDSSGKLVIAQWMDWVFRGGRAAGEPAPPLPIIGALRNR